MSVFKAHAMALPAGLAALAPVAAATAQAQTVMFDGVIDSIEGQGKAVVHLTDPATGKRYAMQGGTRNTYDRLGLDAAHLAGAKVAVTVLVLDGGACKGECQVKLRSMTFPDGRKVFLGGPG